MENSTPLISVVITAYNRPDYLRESVASALAQTFTDIEIIVVDDCSPTDPLAVLSEFDFPIRGYRMPVNGGANPARNQGVRMATGKYVAFLDDDDIWLPRKLELQLQRLSNSTACLCGFELLDTGRKIVRTVHEVTDAMLKVGNPYGGMTGLICEREWLLANPFDETLGNGQDWDIYVRLSRVRPIAYVQESLFRYRRSSSHESITTKLKTQGVAEMERRLAVTYKHREWLGEWYFRRRVAALILGYLGHRSEPWKLVLMALRIGGVRATASVLAEKFSHFMKRGGKIATH